jgi:LacI family transcriptional regulator
MKRVKGDVCLITSLMAKRAPCCQPMVTSRDVAQLAGVSQATVSRVLHGNPNVDEGRRRRVLEALAATGYVVNASARAMRTSRTGTVGVVAGRITNPFYPELIDAIGRELTIAGTRMILWTAGGSSEPAAVDAIRGGAVDGVILTTATSESVSLKAAVDRHAPIVLVNRSIAGGSCDQVTSDNVAGGRLVADYFLKHGHTKIAMIGQNDASSTSRHRREGFVERLGEAGIQAHHGPKLMAEFSHAVGRRVGLELLSRKDRPTALFCADDQLAFGALDAARELKLSVPGDLWVVGYDDVEMAAWSSFDLTTVRQPIADMAQAAVSMLRRRITQPDRPTEHRCFDPKLIIRGSSGVLASTRGSSVS